jgi:hypothetical protein
MKKKLYGVIYYVSAYTTTSWLCYITCLDLLLENVDKNSIDDFVGSRLLVFQHFTGIFIGLGVHIFNVLGCTRTNDVISKDNRSSVQDVERLDQFHIGYIQVLPVVDEDSINLASVVRVVLEEVSNGAIESSMNDLKMGRRKKNVDKVRLNCLASLN